MIFFFFKIKILKIKKKRFDILPRHFSKPFLFRKKKFVKFRNLLHKTKNLTSRYKKNFFLLYSNLKNVTYHVLIHVGMIEKSFAYV